jgi:hypothetical protein
MPEQALQKLDYVSTILPNATASPAKGYMTNRPYAITHWVTTSNFIPIIGNPNGSDLSGHEHEIVSYFFSDIVL